MAKKRVNVQDATLKNINALKRRVTVLEQDRTLDRQRAEALATAVTRLQLKIDGISTPQTAVESS